MYVGLSLSDPHPDHAGDGSSRRTLSATHFAGRYRLIDFTLSNMVNSKIYDIGIVLNSHYQPLIRHVSTGKEWDLARKIGGITMFPPYLADERETVNNELDGPLRRAAEYVAGSKVDYVVLVDSSVAYNMDYRDAIVAHTNSESDITAIYTKRKVLQGEYGNTVVFDISDEGRVTAVTEAPLSQSKLNVSLGAYVMHKKYFLQLTSSEKNCGMRKFSLVLLAGALERQYVRAYEFKGYSAQIHSLGSYFHYNMEMLDVAKRKKLFDYEGRRISTSRRDSLPTKYGGKADIKNSLIAEGCRIDGTVNNSVICRNVNIREGAIVRNCILHEGVVVEKNAELDWVVGDKGLIITENRSMIGYSTYPVYIEGSRII